MAMAAAGIPVQPGTLGAVCSRRPRPIDRPPGHDPAPRPPAADLADVPDESLLPTVVATADVAHLDLSVLHGGIIEGRVVDRSGHPIGNAMLRARGDGVRPALATDLAQSDPRGRFSLWHAAAE